MWEKCEMFLFMDLRKWDNIGQFDLVYEIIKENDQAKHSGKMKDFLSSLGTENDLHNSKLKEIYLVSYRILLARLASSIVSIILK